MKQIAQLFIFSLISSAAFASVGTLVSTEDDNSRSSILVPSRASEPSPAKRGSRFNRKPAVEARVYVVDPSDRNALYYYDQKDQRPQQQEAKLPMRLSNQ